LARKKRATNQNHDSKKKGENRRFGRKASIRSKGRIGEPLYAQNRNGRHLSVGDQTEEVCR